MGYLLLLVRCQVRVSRRDLNKRARLQSIDQVVSFHADSLAPTHFDKGSRAILVAQLNAEFLTRRRRKRDLLVAEMHARVLSQLGNQSTYTLSDYLLRI